jgi:thymidylate kinase
MDKPEANCEELILSTAKALDSKALKLLFLSSRRNNVKHHIQLAISQ